jgi:uncharacterized protein
MSERKPEHVFEFIGTYTGKELTFLDPKEDQICLEDIVNNLAKICRFAGNVSRFYSVAEHSVILAKKVLSEGGSEQEALGALFHDATEAYLCDVARPIKKHLGNYMEIEQGLQDVIFSKFGLEPMSQRVEDWDINIVADEAAELFQSVPDWVKYYEPLGVQITGWSCDKAEIEFLKMYNKLTGV